MTKNSILILGVMIDDTRTQSSQSRLLASPQAGKQYYFFYSHYCALKTLATAPSWVFWLPIPVFIP